MAIHLGDSHVYGHLWATDEARAILGEQGRFAAWLDILATLAEAQAEVGLVPPAAAEAIRALADTGSLDLEEVGAETRACGHSTLGLIRVLRRSLPEDAAEWVYYGATVQDLSDTWTATVMRRIGDLLARDLARIEEAARALAAAHRLTPMLGRTHAQPGLLISFGFKAAVWLAEIQRHRRRLEQGRARWEMAQLGGALGTMEFWGDRALPLLDAFARRMGLGAPPIPWITSRDGPAEFVNLLAMVATTIAKVGNEIMELQRPELGEVSEPFVLGTVGSITMPQKRNPEISEHLDTLARLVRAQALVVTEGMVQIHERDGRAWKAEWVAVPEACALTLTATGFAATLLEGLGVDARRMEDNIDAQGGYVFAEPVMRALATQLGKHTAQEIIYDVATRGREQGIPFFDALAADRRVTDHIDLAAVMQLTDRTTALGAGPLLVDRVLGERR
jgi:adenylosuccinate lyase